MVTHVNPTSIDGRDPAPSEHIVLDLMALVLSCVSVQVGDGDVSELVDLLHNTGVTQYGFGDDVLIDLLRQKGYHVELTDAAFTISLPQ